MLIAEGEGAGCLFDGVAGCSENSAADRGSLCSGRWLVVRRWCGGAGARDSEEVSGI